MQVNQEAVQSLLQSEGFKVFKLYLLKMREEIKERWAEGMYTTESESGTIQLNARQIGKVEVLDILLDDELSYEEIVEYLNDK